MNPPASSAALQLVIETRAHQLASLENFISLDLFTVIEKKVAHENALLSLQAQKSRAVRSAAHNPSASAPQEYRVAPILNSAYFIEVTSRSSSTRPVITAKSYAKHITRKP